MIFCSSASLVWRSLSSASWQVDSRRFKMIISFRLCPENVETFMTAVVMQSMADKLLPIKLAQTYKSKFVNPFHSLSIVLLSPANLPCSHAVRPICLSVLFAPSLNCSRISFGAKFPWFATHQHPPRAQQQRTRPPTHPAPPFSHGARPRPLTDSDGTRRPG